MTDMSIPEAVAEAAGTQKPQYLRPTLKVLSQDEVLEAFQMTATEISAAGCWWGSC